MKYIEKTEEGNFYFYIDKKRTVLHRVGKPAIEWIDGSEKWYYKGKCHRENGPAFTLVEGNKFYMEYRIYDLLHREDGPALVRMDGSKEWYLYGLYYFSNMAEDKVKEDFLKKKHLYYYLTKYKDIYKYNL